MATDLEEDPRMTDRLMRCRACGCRFTLHTHQDSADDWYCPYCGLAGEDEGLRVVREKPEGLRFHIRAQGDPTVGDGTHLATVDVPYSLPGDGGRESAVQYLRSELAAFFGEVFDVSTRRVQVLTDEEVRKEEEAEDEENQGRERDVPRFTCPCGNVVDVTPTWRRLKHNAAWANEFCSAGCATAVEESEIMGPIGKKS